MKNVAAIKSYESAIRIVTLYKRFSQEKREFVLSKQLLKSATSTGALVKVTEHAQSKADFLNKMNVALKEANETEYCLMLMKDTAYLKEEECQSIKKDSSEILKLLITIVKSTKTSLEKIIVNCQ